MTMMVASLNRRADCCRRQGISPGTFNSHACHERLKLSRAPPLAADRSASGRNLPVASDAICPTKSTFLHSTSRTILG